MSYIYVTARKTPNGSQTQEWEVPWRRKRQPTPVFLLGKSHGQRSLAGYSPWGYKELNTTEQLTLLGASSKEPACQCKRRGFDPWVRKISWRRAWQPTLGFLPGESHRQRSLAGSQRVGHDWSDLAWHGTECTCESQSPIYPSPPYPLVTKSVFSTFVTLFLFHRFICTL